ncbi:MAG: type II secretion system protein [Colwellia sp.]
MPFSTNSTSKINIAYQMQRGFTLVETIVGIVVLSVVFTIFTSFIYPLSNQSAEQVHQIRASELGQSMINEILGRAFDEYSGKSGGLKRCGETGYTACSSVIGPEPGESRESFDDVDDYDTKEIPITPKNALGESIKDEYIGYKVLVKVIHDSNYDGIADSNYSTAKLITVTILTPQDFGFVFSIYKANF